MALPQDISPLNPELMDTMVQAQDQEWIPFDDSGQAFIKVLWTGSETGRWAVIIRWLKGYSAPSHKHLSGAHVYMISGRIQVRDGVIGPGDYLYERNGMVHEATTALEDTEYLFICDGPVLFYDNDGFTTYLGWEELERMRAAHEKAKVAA